MRRWIAFVPVLLICVSPFFWGASAQAAPPIEVGVSLDVSYFYDQLSPYGEWVEDPNYGWVWSPAGIDAAWRPYTYGHWVYTEDDGWLWVADEEWGWAPYHYGRWFVSAGRWLWVPGPDWGPAWVSWRNGGGYIGWAALPPQAAFSIGVGLQIGPVELDAFLQPSLYCFVEERHFVDPRIATVIVAPTQNITIINVTKNITNYTVNQNRVVNRSLPVEQLERAVGRPIPRARVVETSVSTGPHRVQVQGNQIKVFRPPIKAAPPNKKLVPPSVAARLQSSAPPSKPSGSAEPSGQSNALELERQQLAQKHAQEKADLEKRHTQEIQNPPKGVPVEKVQARHESEHQALQQKQEKEVQQLARREKPAPRPTPKPH
jgi:hypothetical protein